MQTSSLRQVDAVQDKLASSRVPVENSLQSRFHIGRVIGRGVQTLTYEAGFKNPFIGGRSKVGLKVFFGNGHKVAIRARREALTLLACRSENVVRLYDYVARAEYDYSYLVFHLGHQRPLAEYLVERGGTLPFVEACELLTSVLRGLSSVHRAGVLHRDLSVESVLISPTGEARLANFHMASPVGFVSRTSGTAELLSSAGSQAPETLYYGESSERSDLYAAALLFYRLLTGGLPFRANTLFSLMQKMSDEDWMPLDGQMEPIPRGLPELFRRAFAAVPARRYGSCAELIQAIRFVGSAGSSRKIQKLELKRVPSKGELFNALPAPDGEDAPRLLLHDSFGADVPELEPGEDFSEGVSEDEQDESFETEDGEQSSRSWRRQSRESRERREGQRSTMQFFVAGGIFFVLVAGALGVTGYQYSQLDGEAEPVQEAQDTSPAVPLELPVIETMKRAPSEARAMAATVPDPAVDTDRALPSAFAPLEARYSVLVNPVPGGPSTVSVRLSAEETLEPIRLAIQTGEGTWFAPLIPTPRRGEYWSVFPARRETMALALMGHAGGKDLFWNRFEFTPRCVVPSGDRLFAAQLVLASAYEIVHDDPYVSGDYAVWGQELPAPGFADSLYRCRAGVKAESVWGEERSPESEKSNDERIIEVLQSRLRRLLTPARLDGLNQLASVMSISDRTPVFADGLAEDELIFRLTLVGIWKRVSFEEEANASLGSERARVKSPAKTVSAKAAPAARLSEKNQSPRVAPVQGALKPETKAVDQKAGEKPAARNTGKLSQDGWRLIQPSSKPSVTSVSSGGVPQAVTTVNAPAAGAAPAPVPAKPPSPGSPSPEEKGVSQLITAPTEKAPMKNTVVITPSGKYRLIAPGKTSAPQ